MKPAALDQAANDARQAALDALLALHAQWWAGSPEGKTLSTLNADFSGLSFEGADLRGGNLVQCTLAGACFKNANLESINLSQSDFRGADFSGANLRSVDFKGVQIDAGTHFAGAKTEGMIVDLQTLMLLPDNINKAQLQLSQTDNKIDISLEFPQFFHGIGIKILNDFADVILSKYPDLGIEVEIKREGNKVRFMVKSASEKALALVGQDMNTFRSVIFREADASSLFGTVPKERMVEAMMAQEQLNSTIKALHDKISDQNRIIRLHEENAALKQGILLPRTADDTKEKAAAFFTPFLENFTAARALPYHPFIVLEVPDGDRPKTGKHVPSKQLKLDTEAVVFVEKVHEQKKCLIFLSHSPETPVEVVGFSMDDLLNRLRQKNPNIIRVHKTHLLNVRMVENYAQKGANVTVTLKHFPEKTVEVSQGHVGLFKDLCKL